MAGVTVCPCSFLMGAIGGMKSIRLDWSQVVNHYLSTKHPNSKQLILTWGENQRFDITQMPRLNDIHYIDTLLSLCYYCTTGQLSLAFERELEKYLSLPITFSQTLPLFEHNPKHDEVDSLFRKATDGIRIFQTPDRKYKIYCCEDRYAIVDGGTERLCLLRGGLAYGSRQAFFDALTSYRLLKSFFCILEKIVFDCKDVSFQSSTL